MRAAGRERHHVAVAGRRQRDHGPPHGVGQRCRTASGWRTRSSRWAPVAATISRMKNRIRTLAIGARSFETTRASVPNAGACRPSFRIHRTQKTEAASAPDDGVAAGEHDSRHDGQQADQARDRHRPAQPRRHRRRVLVVARRLPARPTGASGIRRGRSKRDGPDDDAQCIRRIGRQLVDRQQDHGEQADAEHAEMKHPPPAARRRWVGVAQKRVDARPQTSGPWPSRRDHRHPGLRIATRGTPVYGRARLAGYGSGFKVVRDLRIAVDIGGTFTDVVLEEGGRRLTRKVLTTPQRPEQAVLDGVRLILADAGRGFGDVAVFVHGTTLATNAIIERSGARTALIATEGFRDILDIANESRYDQYDLTIEKPQPLVPRALRFTVPERVDVHGEVRLPLDEAAVRALARRARHAGRRERRRRLPARLRQSGARAAHARDPARRAARPLGHAVQRGLPGDARVRAHLDRGRQRLCAAADGLLPRAHADGARGRDSAARSTS